MSPSEIAPLSTEKIFFKYTSDLGYSVKDITLNLKPGCFYGLIGPNGSGKSTLLDLLSGYALPSAGKVNLFGKEIHSYARKEIARLISSVPQSISLSFDYRVEEVVLMGRYVHIPRFTPATPTDIKKVSASMELMGISHLKDRKVTNLSGGEKQRVMIARSLAQETDIILLDEVTSNLDINHALSIMTTMANLSNSANRTIVAALHDLNIASMFCDELIVLNDGQLARSGNCQRIISEELLYELYKVPSKISVVEKGKKHIRFPCQ